ncbi:MAG: lysophospholipid acyltransferase family protein [Acidobacteriota bacterium]
MTRLGLLSWLRVAYRLPRLLLRTLIEYPLLVTGAALLRARGRDDRPWVLKIYQRWADGALRDLGCRLTVRGTPPQEPFLLICNHVSYVDIIALASQADCTFVAKAEISRWPIVNRLAKSVGTLFIDRSARRDALRVAKRIGELMESPRGIVIFAEGTTSDGSTILPLKTPLLASGKERPVHYATVTYAVPVGCPPARNSVSWWGDASLLPHVLTLTRLPFFYATVVFGPAPILEPDRKRLASILRDAMVGQFDPVSG